MTFVSHNEFKLLCYALAQPGRGIVVEGPSGAGKTTAMRFAISKLKKEGMIHELEYLNARNKKHIRTILDLIYLKNGLLIQ